MLSALTPEILVRKQAVEVAGKGHMFLSISPGQKNREAMIHYKARLPSNEGWVPLLSWLNCLSEMEC